MTKIIVTILAYACAIANSEELVTDEIKKRFVDAHNLYRGMVSSPFAKEMPAVVWDDFIGAKAQAFAEYCPTYHSSVSYRQYNDPEYMGKTSAYMGENIYFSGALPTPEVAIKAFYSEYVNYNYTTMSSNGTTGHYTQVVWANTKRIGCGISYCPYSNYYPYTVVCEYYPGGNGGGRPYINGTKNCTTCAAMNYECGEYTNSCGEKVTCNSCKTCEKCENHKCVCYPKTECDEDDCGTVSDGCGGVIQCGKCKYPGQTCGERGKCSCTNRRSCYTYRKDCGTFDDGCGGNLTCGTCYGEKECRDNVCTCQNGTTCADLGYECGYTDNGCGRNLTCGFCPSDLECINHECVYIIPSSESSIGYRDPVSGSAFVAPVLCTLLIALVVLFL